MVSLQEIFQKYGDSYMKSNIVDSHQVKVITAIKNCRTEQMGNRIQVCEDCGFETITYCSCRNRHCPKCQIYAKEEWINNRTAELMDIQYFHVVFTIPDEFRMIVKANERILYKILFKSVSETLSDLSRDSKHLGAEIGATLVLHTWSQNILYHPHIHSIVTGGGLTSENQWKDVKSRDFYIHVNILSRVFKGKFMEYFIEEYAIGNIILPKSIEYLSNPLMFYRFKDELYRKNWYVYAKETFNSPSAVIEYLGRYTHRVAISDSRILKVEDGYVSFKWRDNKDKGKEKILVLKVFEFIRRFLLHVLPAGFVKIRYIGIVSNRNKSTKLKRCQYLTMILLNKKLFVKKTKEQILMKITSGSIFICPCCGSNKMRLVLVNPTYFFDTG